MPPIQEKVTLTEEEQQDLFRQVAQTGETESNVLRAWRNKPPFVREAEMGNKCNLYGRHGKKGAKKRRKRK
jgi:hypothetical protein